MKHGVEANSALNCNVKVNKIWKKRVAYKETKIKLN
jgi:hypothetical protein